MTDLEKIDEDLVYVRVAVETLWLYMATRTDFDVKLATGLIDESIYVIETDFSSPDVCREQLRQSLDTLAARLLEIRRAAGLGSDGAL
jgi:hypothetical protein